MGFRHQWLLVVALLLAFSGAAAWVLLGSSGRSRASQGSSDKTSLEPDAMSEGAKSGQRRSSAGPTSGTLPQGPSRASTDDGAIAPPNVPAPSSGPAAPVPGAVVPSDRAPAGSGTEPRAVGKGATDAPTPATPSSTKPSYTGADSCKKCHLRQYKSWTDTAMASAFKVLGPGMAVEKKRAAGLDPQADYAKTGDCLRCHTTGYGTESGFPALALEGSRWDVAEEQRAVRFRGVACESCHGPGSLYGPYKKDHPSYARAEIRDLGATIPAACEGCHKRECPTMPADYSFDAQRGRERAQAIHEHAALKNAHGD